MRSSDALRVLAELTAQQWGMVTSAQAGLCGVTRLLLSRLADDGQLRRLAHGVYMDAGAPGDQLDDLRAAWLSTDPKFMAAARIKDRANEVVVAGSSAARLHGIGDLWAERHEFVSPGRRQSQRPEIRYRPRTLDPRDVTLVAGLPVMTMERTIADLVEDVGDLSLVADALRDAALDRTIDPARLGVLLAPLADRNGFTKGDGSALLNRLLEIAGIDLDAVSRRVAADTALGSRVTANYLGGLSKANLERLAGTPEMRTTMRTFQDSIAALLHDALPRQLTEPGAPRAPIRAKPVDVDNLAKKIAERFVTGGAIRDLGRAWSASLSGGTTIDPATLAVARTARMAVEDDRS